MCDFDVAVIGGGPGGYVAAEAAAKAGLSTLLFEERDLGGTCLNRGCIPTKALLRSGHIFEEAAHGEKLGVIADPKFDFEAAHANKAEIVQKLRAGVGQLMKKCGVNVIAEHAQISGEHTVVAGGQTYDCKNIIIATGTTPAHPSVEGIDLPGVYTSDDLLEDNPPNVKSIAIFGVGVIGMEFASFFQSIGAEVNLFGRGPQVLRVLDSEISQRLMADMKKRGVKFNMNASVKKFSGTPGNMTVTYDDKDGNEQEVNAEGILVCTGRTPNTAGLFTSDFTVEMNRGYIVCDENGQTSCPSIYAIGDVRAGAIQLAHFASAQGENVVNVIAGKKPEIDEGVVPSCVYTAIEIAEVGTTQAKAKEAGIEVDVAKLPLGTNGRCLIEGAQSGLYKLVFDHNTHKLLGASLMCPFATELIAELALAVKLGLTAEDIERTIHAHPTINELTRETTKTIL